MSAAAKSAQFWDKRAEKYEKSAISDPEAYEFTLERTRSYLRRQDRVLELGSGTGSTALRLAERVDSIVATDVSTKMTEIGARKAKAQGAKNIRFVTTGVEDHAKALGGETFDVVMAFNLLHLVPDIDASLCQIFRLVKPGGLFISKTICNTSRFSPFFSTMKLLLPLLQRINVAPFVRLDPVEVWEQRIESAGFTLLERSNHPMNPPRRYLVARRPEL